MSVMTYIIHRQKTVQMLQIKQRKSINAYRQICARSNKLHAKTFEKQLCTTHKMKTTRQKIR